MSGNKTLKQTFTRTTTTEQKEAERRERNLERQHRYRHKALHDPDGSLLTRLQIMLSPYAAGCLDRAVAATGKSKRQIVEQALVALEHGYSSRELVHFGGEVLS